MPSFSPTLQPGNVTTQAVTAADLGNVFWEGKNAYRVVKAAADITTPAGFVVVTALSTGLPTWSVNTSTTANDYLVAGVIPTTYTATIASGSYFVIQVAGPCTAVSAAAITVGTLVGCSTTAGKIDDASITAGVGAIGIATLVAAGADVVTNVYLKGLI